MKTTPSTHPSVEPRDQKRSDCADCSGLQAHPVGFLPIAAEYLRRLDVAKIIDEATPSQMRISCGMVIEAMVLDTLTGRSPFYRMEEFAAHQDIELLLGRSVTPSQFRDHNIGRALDRVYRANPQQLFVEIARRAIEAFEIDARCGHYDTTSVNVWGDYSDSDCKALTITHGYSKDKRPDLKQFLMEMICVENNIPIFGRCSDGNGSDTKRNNALLSNLSRLLARHGI